jgi:hypothetical protein
VEEHEQIFGREDVDKCFGPASVVLRGCGRRVGLGPQLFFDDDGALVGNGGWRGRPQEEAATMSAVRAGSAGKVNGMPLTAITTGLGTGSARRCRARLPPGGLGEVQTRREVSPCRRIISIRPGGSWR